MDKLIISVFYDADNFYKEFKLYICQIEHSRHRSYHNFVI